jgi:hypothetical protein
MQVISYREAAERAGIVRRSLERLIAKGEGPAVVHVSVRRRGILEHDLSMAFVSPPGAARRDGLGTPQSHGGRVTSHATDTRNPAGGNSRA